MSGILDHRWGESAAADRVWSHVAGMRSIDTERRGYMVLRAFVDDSAQEGRCYVLAGYIASSEKWASFSREWERLLLSGYGVRMDNDPPIYHFNDNPPLYHFKMNEMMASPERQAQIPAFSHVIYENALFEFAWGLRLDDIPAAMERVKVPGINPKPRPTLTPFHFVFFALMEQFSIWLQESPQTVVKEPVDFFFDESAEKKQIVSNWFAYIEAHTYIGKVFGSLPRFENDRTFLPLQAADYLAFKFRQLMQGEIERDWGRQHVPGLYNQMSQEQLVQIYYRILRQTYPDRLIYDTKSDLHPVLQEEYYRTKWKTWAPGRGEGD